MTAFDTPLGGTDTIRGLGVPVGDAALYRIVNLTAAASGEITVGFDGWASVFGWAGGGGGATTGGAQAGGGGGGVYIRLRVIKGQRIQYVIGAAGTDDADGQDTVLILPNGVRLVALGGKAGVQPTPGAGGGFEVNGTARGSRGGSGGGGGAPSAGTAGEDGGGAGGGTGSGYSGGGGAAGFGSYVAGLDPGAGATASAAAGPGGGASSNATNTQAAGAGRLLIYFTRD